MLSKEKQLEFSIDPKSGVPLYKQIILQIEMAMADGRLSSGDQLPTVRALAVELQVNPNTVARSYSELEIRGIVNTQQGTGTFIGDKKIEVSDVERERILAELSRSFIIKAASYGFSISEILSYIRDLDAEKHPTGGI
ncbi:MAG TPA: GntR family transcriptional regulator [Spirochaetia bacterium]|nr:GntR family transcriptional regulator [Spirochaetia bacterium]